MVNAVFGANDSGDTYYLRTGGPLVEESRMYAVQLQRASSWRGLGLVYGSDFRATDPRTRGTVHGSYESDDFTRETGVYLQGTAPVGRRLRAIGALRVDHHNRMQDAAFSPRVALHYKPAAQHALRLTYNRAFNAPYPNELFLDTRVNTLTGFPYEIRQHRVPPGGMTFARDCDGLCMHSPYSTAGAGPLPADATALWPEMVALLAQRGIDIGDIPAPASASVSTVLALRNQGARTFEPIAASDVNDLPPLRRQITNALELGYLGALRSGAAFAADLHVTRVRHRLVGSALAVTPNVFFDRGTLEQYLGGYRDGAAAAEIATVLAQVPVGIITPVESRYPTDILLIGRQGQSYTLWGIDLSAELPLTPRVTLSGTYSRIGYDTLSAATPDVPVVLIMPAHKGAFAAAFRSARGTLLSSARVRAVGSIRQRGLFRDPTAPAYVVMDVSAAWRVPPARRLLVAAELRNAFGRVHREYPGGAAIGRLALVRARIEF
jgi:outer membrane receptor protein involved in Fe transport